MRRTFSLSIVLGAALITSVGATLAGRREKAFIPPPENQCATFDDFASLRIGMTYYQVSTEFGCDGEISAAAEKVKTYSWRGADGRGFVLITFVENKLTTKSQAGLR